MYQITWAHGAKTVTADTLDEAEEIVRARYPGAVIGHDGDLREHGDRTLCWESPADSAGDDGRQSVASIIRI